MAANIQAFCKSHPLDNYIEIEGTNVPLEYICPISREIMTYPMTVFPGGHSFDRNSLLSLQNSEAGFRNPFSHEYIREVAPNKALHSTIERFCNQSPRLKQIFQEAQISILSCPKPHLPPEEPHVYSADQFAALFQDRDEITFSSNQTIRISHLFRRAAYDYLCNWQIDPLRSLLEIFDSILLTKMKRLDKFGIAKDYAIEMIEDKIPGNYSLVLHFESSLKIKVKNGLVAKIDMLFEQMLAANMDELILAPNTSFILQISDEDKRFYDEGSPLPSLTSIFRARLPSTLSDICIRFNDLDIRYADKAKALVLIDSGGFKISLVRKIIL